MFSGRCRGNVDASRPQTLEVGIAPRRFGRHINFGLWRLGRCDYGSEQSQEDVSFHGSSLVAVVELQRLDLPLPQIFI